MAEQDTQASTNDARQGRSLMLRISAAPTFLQALEPERPLSGVISFQISQDLSRSLPRFYPTSFLQEESFDREVEALEAFNAHPDAPTNEYVSLADMYAKTSRAACVAVLTVVHGHIAAIAPFVHAARRRRNQSLEDTRKERGDPTLALPRTIVDAAWRGSGRWARQITPADRLYESIVPGLPEDVCALKLMQLMLHLVCVLREWDGNRVADYFVKDMDRSYLLPLQLPGGMLRGKLLEANLVTEADMDAAQTLLTLSHAS